MKIRPHRLLTIGAALLAAACAAPAPAPVPGPGAAHPTMVRGVDHVGLTVPDANQAVAFFSDVLGCQEAFRFGPFKDDKTDFMRQLLDVDPRAVIEQLVMMRCGQGSNIELFQYSAPDQQRAAPRNSDWAGHHVAFYVADIEPAARALRARGIKTFLGPFKVDAGPAAGQSILYFLAPWGQQLELISYPGGMAYERDSSVKLWAPGAP